MVGVVINFYQHDSWKKTQRMLYDKVRWIWFMLFNIIEHYSNEIHVHMLRDQNPIQILQLADNVIWDITNEFRFILSVFTPQSLWLDWYCFQKYVCMRVFDALECLETVCARLLFTLFCFVCIPCIFDMFQLHSKSYLWHMDSIYSTTVYCCKLPFCYDHIMWILSRCKLLLIVYKS